MRAPNKKEQFPEFDFGPAREARDEALERVVAHSPEIWKMNYCRLMSERPDLGPSFIAEDFRLYATPLIGKPHTHKSWGGMWNSAIHKGWVIPTRAQGQMKTIKSHAKSSPLYCWPNRVIVPGLE